MSERVPALTLAPRHKAADIVLRAIGVQGDFRPFQHAEQLVLIGVQPLQQPVEHGECGAALEDALEAPAQG